MKNAFTFAELMISIVVIGVITALLYPTISELSPNNNKHLYRTAYRTVEMIVQDIISEEEIPGNPARHVMPNNATITCQEFARRMNVTNITAAMIAANPDLHQNCVAAANGHLYLTTSNGMRWIFQMNGNNTIIQVDVNASNNNARASTYTYNGIAINNDWAQGSFIGGAVGQNEDTVQDTFTIVVTPNGTVSNQDQVGAEHLKNSKNDKSRY